MTFLSQFWFRRLAPLAIAIVSLSPLVAQQAAPPESADSARPISDEQLDRLVQPYLDAGVLQAVSIGLVGGGESWTRHYGTLSADQPKPPTDETLYEIGSITKVFTGVLLADAVVAGQLKLEQPIGTLMPTLQTENKEVAQSIQLVHLATHTSGLPRLPDNLNPSNPEDPYADFGREELVKFMSGVHPEKPPGQPSGYSNLAVGLLGDLMAAHAEMSYEQLLQQKITEPLGMKDTMLQLKPDQSDRLAPPHNAAGKADSRWTFDAMAGAGAIVSNTSDMVRFMQATLDPPAGAIKEAIHLAYQEQTPAVGDAFAMGLGWHIARDGHTCWHNGQTGGYHTMMLVSRDLNLGVVLMTNTATEQADALAESIFQAMAGMPVQPRNFDTETVDPKVVARLAGKYPILPQFVLTVRAEKDKLFVQATGQPEIQVFPESETRWVYRVVDAQLEFELPDDGSAKSLTLFQAGQVLKARRSGD